MNISKRWAKNILLNDDDVINKVNDIDVNYEEGRFIAALSSYIWVCAIMDGDIITKLKGHKGKVTCLSYTPDFKNFFSGSIDCTIIKWSHMFEIVSKYQCVSSVQFLKFNPMHNIVLICGESFYGIWKNDKLNFKQDNTIKILTCCWNQQGKLYALGLQSGAINFVDQKGETKYSIVRSNATTLEHLQSITSMCWINNEIIAVADAGLKLSFYNIHGHQVNKERSLNFVPQFIEPIVCQNENMSSLIHYLVIGGSNGMWEIYNNEGTKVTNLLKNLCTQSQKNNDSSQDVVFEDKIDASSQNSRWPVTCCKPIFTNDTLRIDQSDSIPMPRVDIEIRKPLVMVVGIINDEPNFCPSILPNILTQNGGDQLMGHGDGHVVSYGLKFSIVTDSFSSTYATTESSTDVIVAELVTGLKARIRCRDVVKCLSLYHDTLGIVTRSNKIIIYESRAPAPDHVIGDVADKGGDAILHYKIVNRLAVGDFDLSPHDATTDDKDDFDDVALSFITLGRTNVYVIVNYRPTTDKAGRKISVIRCRNYRGSQSCSSSPKDHPGLTLDDTTITACVLAGGPADNERLIMATDDHQVYGFTMNPQIYPVVIMDLRSVTKVRDVLNRLYINRPFCTRLACLDTTGHLSIFDTCPLGGSNGKAIVFQENNVISCCWYEDEATTLCYMTGSGLICVHDGTSRVYQVENYGKAIGLIHFCGDTLYLASGESMDPIAIYIPQTEVIQHLVAKERFRETLDYIDRCLYYRGARAGSCATLAPAEREVVLSLGNAALVGLDLATARACFVQAKQYQYLDLINDLQELIQDGCSLGVKGGGEGGSRLSQMAEGYVAAFGGDFEGAARVWEGAGYPKLAADMYCSLQMFEEAKPFLATTPDTADNKGPLHYYGDQSAQQPAEPDGIQTANLMISDGRLEVALDILRRHRAYPEILTLADVSLNRIATMSLQADPDTRRVMSLFFACTDELVDREGKLNKQLMSLYEKAVFTVFAGGEDRKEANVQKLARRLYDLYKGELEDRLRSTQDCDDDSTKGSQLIYGKLSKLVDHYPDLFSSQRLHLGYAVCLLNMGHLGSAIEEYRLAGVAKSPCQLIGDMIECAISEDRYSDASYHYLQLWSHFTKGPTDLPNSIDSRTSVPGSVEIVACAGLCYRLAEIYYVYQRVYDYWAQPFTPFTPDELYHMCRYLYDAMRSFEKMDKSNLLPHLPERLFANASSSTSSGSIKGVSKSLILSICAKLALKCGSYSSAKDLISQLTSQGGMIFSARILGLMERRDSLSLLPLKVVERNDDVENMGGKSRQTINSTALGNGMDGGIIKSFRQSFFDQNARTILKGKSLRVSPPTTDVEQSQPFCYSCQNNTHFSHHSNGDLNIESLYFPKCSTCHKPFIFSFLSFDILPLYQIEEKNSKQDSSEEDILKIVNPSATIYLRNALPDMPQSQCLACQKIYYAEEWELYVIQHKKCPFCRTPAPGI